MFEALLNPTPPELGQQPTTPTTPEEFQTRKSGWLQVIDGLRSNPNIGQALLFAGSRLLQGQRPGQTFGGTLGEAVAGGVGMYGTLEQNVAKQQQDAEKFELEKENSAAQRESQLASAEANRSLVEERRLEMQKSQLEAPLLEQKRSFLMALARNNGQVNPETLPPMERAWYYEAMKPEIAAELQQARAELAMGQAQAAAQRVALATERLAFDRTKEGNEKKSGKTIVHQTKGDDGNIYRVVRDGDVETTERIVPGMARQDAQLEAEAEWDAENGAPRMFGKRDPAWLKKRTQFYMTPRVEAIGAPGAPPAAPDQPGKSTKRSMTLAEAEALDAGTSASKPAASSKQPVGDYKSGGRGVYLANFPVKSEKLDPRSGGRTVYFVEGDPSNKRFTSEAAAKARSQDLKSGK